MYKFVVKTIGISVFTIALTSTASANNAPIKILLDTVNLDLSNPSETAKRVIDRDFKSNDPSIRSRIYKLNDGTTVRLIGRNFDNVSDIDKIRITYPKNEMSYIDTFEALTDQFGAASTKRPDVLVWRLDNTTKTSTQGKTIKIIARKNNAEKRIITADRQRGGKGNNQRRRNTKTTSAPAAVPAPTTLRPAERD